MGPPSSYLLTDIPPDLRRALSEVAAQENCSIADVIRSALSDHYGLNLRRRGRRYVPEIDQGTERLVIRAEAKLFNAVRKEANKKHKTMRRVILDILTDRYLVSLGT